MSDRGELSVFPFTLKGANDYIAVNHRHHKRVVGHRFSLGVTLRGEIVGCCVVGRPVARRTDAVATAEVTRLCTDGTPNACSILYAAAARACKAMGFLRIQTFTMPDEGGASLRASGWVESGLTPGRSWSVPSRPRGNFLFEGMGDDHPKGPKVKWIRQLNPKTPYA